jgi:uracil-DNA glycosylase
MLLEGLKDLICDEIFSVTYDKDADQPLFNPYNDWIPGVDLPGADRIRRENLLSHLKCYPKRPSFLIVGEAPGWRGCRFSGVPFTSEAQLADGALPFQGRRTSLRDHPYSESTANIFWQVMRVHYPDWLAWNSLPFHPHQPGDYLSNRTPTRAEIAAHSELLKKIILLLQPGQIIAVGRKAEFALQLIKAPYIPVRHPARGGAYEFGAGMRTAFLIEVDAP